MNIPVFNPLPVTMEIRGSEAALIDEDKVKKVQYIKERCSLLTTLMRKMMYFLIHSQ